MSSFKNLLAVTEEDNTIVETCLTKNMFMTIFHFIFSVAKKSIKFSRKIAVLVKVERWKTAKLKVMMMIDS